MSEIEMQTLPLERIPLVDQAIELAAMLPMNSKARAALLDSATMVWYLASTPTYFVSGDMVKQSESK